MKQKIRIQFVPWVAVVVAMCIVAIIWLSFTLAKKNQSEREALAQATMVVCESRNPARADIRDTFILVLEALDPDRSSPLWREGPNGEPSIEDILNDKLAPIECADV